MSGTITRWDVLRNARVVIQGFGWACFLRALLCRYPTFLVCCCELRSAR